MAIRAPDGANKTKMTKYLLSNLSYGIYSENEKQLQLKCPYNTAQCINSYQLHRRNSFSSHQTNPDQSCDQWNHYINHIETNMHWIIKKYKKKHLTNIIQTLVDWCRSQFSLSGSSQVHYTIFMTNIKMEIMTMMTIMIFMTPSALPSVRQRWRGQAEQRRSRNSYLSWTEF